MKHIARYKPTRPYGPRTTQHIFAGHLTSIEATHHPGSRGKHSKEQPIREVDTPCANAERLRGRKANLYVTVTKWLISQIADPCPHPASVCCTWRPGFRYTMSECICFAIESAGLEMLLNAGYVIEEGGLAQREG
jgi:hypothetical protein